MPKALIEQCHNNLERAVQFGKTTNESNTNNHFWNLLNENPCRGTKNEPFTPYGILKNLREVDIGLWENKRQKRFTR